MNPEETQAIIVKTMQDTAHLYAAETVLREWLRKHGIIYAEGNNGMWYVKFIPPASKEPYPNKFESFPQMLDFVLTRSEEFILAQGK